MLAGGLQMHCGWYIYPMAGAESWGLLQVMLGKHVRIQFHLGPLAEKQSEKLRVRAWF